MQANELRINNLIAVKGFCVKVSKETFKHIEDGKVLEAEPIPLTEEWLIKFGFVREGMLTMRLGEFTCYCEEDYIDNFCLGDIELFDVIPKYVHQLQNLYFALTGEELTIKQ